LALFIQKKVQDGLQIVWNLQKLYKCCASSCSIFSFLKFYFVLVGRESRFKMNSHRVWQNYRTKKPQFFFRNIAVTSYQNILKEKLKVFIWLKYACFTKNIFERKKAHLHNYTVVISRAIISLWKFLYFCVLYRSCTQ